MKKRKFSVILAIIMIFALLPATAPKSSGFAPDGIFELPVGGADNQTITWTTADVPSFTTELLKQSDGYLYLESSSPLIPDDWGYGIVLHDGSPVGWNEHSQNFNISGAVGSNTLAIPLNEHTAYTEALTWTYLQLQFFSWSLNQNGEYGLVSPPMKNILTRAYLKLGDVAPSEPGAPRSFAAVPGDGQVSLSWSAPASDGGDAITRYEVSKDNGAAWNNASGSFSHTFTGLTNGTGYTFRVRAVNGVGAGASVSATAAPNPEGGNDDASLTDFIVTDQFGYLPESQKTAVIRNPKTGPDSALPFTPGNVYRVVGEDGNTVHQGAPIHKFDEDAAYGDEIWWFDFSAVTQPGRYYILDVQKNVRSFSFNIADDVYNETLKHAIRMFYYQRAGFAKEAKYAGAGWADSASHLQDKQARYFYAKNNAATARDLSGGWYDAGDYNKYTAWTARYIEDMLGCYRDNPDVFGDDYNIPESGNGIPDIIDEAKWGMDHLLKLQNDGNYTPNPTPPNYPTGISDYDGSMLSVVGLDDASPPSSATGASYYGPPNTTATYAGARAFALGAVVFEQWDSAYAAALKTAADKAWKWAEANPNVMFSNNSDGNNSGGLAAGNQEIGDDSNGDRTENRLYAAYYMYELTGEKSYLKLFDDNYAKFPLTQWSSFMDSYRTSQHFLYFLYMNSPDATPSVAADLKAKLISAFNKSADYAGKLGQDGYRSFLKGYNWGSNKAKSDMGSTFYLWAKNDMEQGKSSSYMSAAEDYVHYIHGVNPFNTVYLTNMDGYGASKSMTTIYHTWFAPNTKWDKAGISEYGPAPGYLPGGPNPNYNVESGNMGLQWSNNLWGYAPTAHEKELGDYIVSNLIGSPPAKMYMDINDNWPINSWEITEPSCGYQTAYIRLLSKFAKPITAESADFEIEVVKSQDKTKDLIEIRNRTGETVSARGFFITNTDGGEKEDEFKYQLPPLIIEKDGSVAFSDDRSLAYIYKRAWVDFDFQSLDKLLLKDAAGNTLAGYVKN